MPLLLSKQTNYTLSVILEEYSLSSWFANSPMSTSLPDSSLFFSISSLSRMVPFFILHTHPYPLSVFCKLSPSLCIQITHASLFSLVHSHTQSLSYFHAILSIPFTGRQPPLHLLAWSSS